MQFEQIETGGGCSALSATVNDFVVLITDQDNECCAPSLTTQRFVVGLYAPNFERLRSVENIRFDTDARRIATKWLLQIEHEVQPPSEWRKS